MSTQSRRRPIRGVTVMVAAAGVVLLVVSVVAVVLGGLPGGQGATMPGETGAGTSPSQAPQAPTADSSSWDASEASATAAPAIAASAPTLLYLPESDHGPGIDSGLLSLTCGADIPYPTSGPDRYKVFYCDDYALPSSQMPYYGIITGHSTQTASIDTVMNRLLLQDELVGRDIYVRTEASGAQWLVFRFVGTEHIDKADLIDAEAWGDSNTSTAGRLVFLACAQERFGGAGTDNVLFTAQFVGVIDAENI